MKPNPKKLSFSTLAILFAAHVALCLFVGVLFSQAIDVLTNGATLINPLLISGIAFLVSHFFIMPKNILADVVINDTTYAGEFYDIFLMKMLMGFQTAQKGLIKIQTGIKKKGTVGTLEIDAFIQAEQDPPKFGGNSNVGARALVTDPVMGYMEIDPKKFEDHWLAVQMNPKLLDRDLPVSFESAVVNRLTELTNNWMDLICWRGSKDNAAIATAVASGLAAGDNNLIFTDGIVKVTKAALANANKITTAVPVGAEAVALTAANIKAKFDQLKGLIQASADGIAAYNDPNFVFVVNYKTGDMYGDAQKAQTNKGEDFTSRGKRTYDGRPIIEVFGQHDDTIWAGVATNDERSQLWLGANEADEQTMFRVAKLQANSEKIFIKMLAKFCFQIATPTQVFLYTTK
jgi:hypothetical protein